MLPWNRARMGMRIGIMSPGRQSIRINSQLRPRPFHPGQPMKIIKPSPFKFRLLVCYAAAAFGCHHIYKSLVFGPLTAAYDDLDKNMDEATRKELEKAKTEDEDDGGFFIPFPGTTKKIMPPPYRGSDPEWQEFIKINSDLELNRKIKMDLAEQIRYICATHQHFTKPLGTQMKIRRLWLDIYYPTSPPPEYERSGIEITDDYVAWTTMPVDSLTVGRIQRALWPSGFFQSAYAFVKVLVSQNSNYLGTVLGLQSKTQSDYESLVDKSVTSKSANRNSIENPGIPSTRNPNPNGAQKQPDIINANSANAKKLNTIEAQTDKPAFTIGAEWLKPSFDLIGGHMSNARLAFSKKWKSRLGSIYVDPPRGSFSVSGFVELESNKAIVLMDVSAHWDPKTKDFDPLSLHYRPRKLIYKKVARSSSAQQK